MSPLPLLAGTGYHDVFSPGLQVRATNSTDDDDVLNVVCAWPVSGQYGPGTRVLYYVLVAACVLARKRVWLRTVCLAAALVVTAVAALHSIVLAALHRPGAIDLDVYGAFQLCAIGILAAPVTVRISQTYFNDPGRNIIFWWTGLLLAGLMSLCVEFFRTNPSPCRHDDLEFARTLNPGNFPYDDITCGLRCSIEEGPSSPLRTGAANDIEVIPAPSKLSFGTLTVLSAGCCILAAVMLISTWIKIREQNRKQLDDDDTIVGTNGATNRRMRGINDSIRDWLRVVELAVYTGAICALLIMGELNFFSKQMLQHTEPLKSVGQWGPLVGTGLGAAGSLYAFRAGDIRRWLKGESDAGSLPDLEPCKCDCPRHSPHGNSKQTVQASAVRHDAASDSDVSDTMVQDQQETVVRIPPPVASRARNSDDVEMGMAAAAGNGNGMGHVATGQTQSARGQDYFDTGHRGQVVRVFMAVNRFLGTASPMNMRCLQNAEALKYPTVPGEEQKNPFLLQTQHSWNVQTQQGRSRAASFVNGSTASCFDPNNPAAGTPRMSQSGISRTSHELQNMVSSPAEEAANLARRDTLPVPPNVPPGRSRSNSSGSPTSTPNAGVPSSPVIVVSPDQETFDFPSSPHGTWPGPTNSP